MRENVIVQDYVVERLCSTRSAHCLCQVLEHGYLWSIRLDDEDQNPFRLPFHRKVSNQRPCKHIQPSTYGLFAIKPFAHPPATSIDAGVCAQSSNHRRPGTTLSYISSPRPGKVVSSRARATSGRASKAGEKVCAVCLEGIGFLRTSGRREDSEKAARRERWRIV